MLLIAATSSACAHLPEDEPVQLTLHVRETAGIRRFGYPVTTRLDFDPPVSSEVHFRLLHDGRPVVAQFRPFGRRAGEISSVDIDFDSSFLPHESRDYIVEFGKAIVPEREPDRGMSVEGAGDHFVVSHGPNLVWTISKDLSGFIQSVKTPKFDYLRSDSVGLSVRLRSGALIPLAPAAWQVTGVIGKHGPIDCTLRFEGTGTAKENRGVSWKLELEFPRSKSWVHVRWQIEDPRDQVAGLVADLNLQVGDGPTLVDFGIDDLVYAALPEGQVVALEAPPRKLQDRPGAAWATYRGPPSKLEPYVIGGSGTPGTRRGWAHVMDRQRCTAVAIDGFGERSRDQIEIESTGRMKIDREAGGISGPKMLDFWIHFVPFPPHIGAVTSPQSMQSPLSVEVAR